jgi:acetoin utilization deacetylase AcuC-like enzyme
MKNIPVFYCPEMSVQTTSYSPSSNKPREAVDDWLMRDFAVTLIQPEAIDLQSLERAHDPKYVQAIFTGEEFNGFGNKDLAVAESLRYTVGAMYEAAHLALMNKQVACAPVSGFHHAGYDFGGGFCTFNGLMVTLYKLRKRGLIKRALIADEDFHFSNGCEHIIKLLGSTDWIELHSLGAHDLSGEESLDYLASTLDKHLPDVDIVLYQAGADAHIDDPLGGVYTTQQMRKRDRIVFETCKKLGVPVAWALAGGYSRDAAGSIEPVLALHRATMEECAKVFIGPRLSTDRSSGFLLDQDDDLDPEGTPLQLLWYLKDQAAQGVPGAKGEAMQFQKMAEAEIRANFELALKALHFPDQKSLIHWMQNDSDAARMAYADATYSEMLRRSWGRS